MNKSPIAILTTVANFDLYQKTVQLFPKNVQKYVIDGRNGMHGIHSILFMINKLKGKGIEWLVMADEDVVFKNSEAVFSIIEKMKNNDITVCGVRDGGIISHRNYNPYLINTFFSILNFKEIEVIWNEKEMLSNQFLTENEFDDEVAKLFYEYDISSLYEPYYCFYLWLRRKGKKFLFLDSVMEEDGVSNNVIFNDEIILCHTWYARSYGISEKHTKRINNLLGKDLNFEINRKEQKEKIIFYKKKTFTIEQMIKKQYRRICLKLK